MEGEKETNELNWKNLLPAIYQDAAQPSAQKIGKALSSIIGIVTTPIGAAAKILENNLEKLTSKLNEIETEKLQPVLPEIGVPILEKLKYTRGEELVELYTELFSKASNSELQDSAHPSYYEIITNLSVYEAKIIDYLSSPENRLVPYLSIKATKKESNTDGIIIHKYITDLPRSIEFYKKENELISIENLIRLGIIEVKENERLRDDSKYAHIYDHPILISYKEMQFEQEIIINEEKGLFTVTQFGLKFIETCIKKTERQS